ncbi:hypothetical protein [Sporichthya polymorpha]|uniref:hypothetical protein n=1 Tax=Sporichthya polymorpha TaxID=35751 RepID=UPI0012EC6FD4|nr:hypothetical protein [Sporichthya polymorpha]
MTQRTRRRRLAAAALFLGAAMGVSAVANGHSAPPRPDLPAEIGDAVTIGSAVLLSE